MAARDRWLTGLVLLVVLGLGLRLFHFVRDPAVWHDEAALVVNVLDKSFPELLGPLDHFQAAPPLFLWLERAVALLLGESAMALRLPALVASCLALVFFAVLARRLLAPAAACWAVLFCAVSDRLLWHAVEVKPYAGDVLVAVVVLIIFTTSGPLPRRLRLATGLAPVLLGSSYAAVFLLGGAMAAVLPAVVRSRERSAWLAFLLLAASVLGSLGLLWLGPIRAQNQPTLHAYWLAAGHFPNWQSPARLPLWLVASTLEVCRYCLQPLGQVLGMLAVAGGVWLWRQGQRPLLTLLVLPLGLALLASGLHLYPYGASRLELFAAPGLILLVAPAAASGLSWLLPRSRPAAVSLILLLLSPAALTAYHLVRPWPRADGPAAARHVLAERLPGDAVAGDDWQALYYFRCLRPTFHYLQDRTALAGVPGPRLWLVLSQLAARNEPERLAGSDWHVQSRRDFDGVTVVLLEKRPDRQVQP